MQQIFVCHRGILLFWLLYIFSKLFKCKNTIIFMHIKQTSLAQQADLFWMFKFCRKICHKVIFVVLLVGLINDSVNAKRIRAKYIHFFFFLVRTKRTELEVWTHVKGVFTLESSLKEPNSQLLNWTKRWTNWKRTFTFTLKEDSEPFIVK